MLSYLENYRKAILKNWVIIPIILFSSMNLFWVMGVLFMSPAANKNNHNNVGFGVFCLCMVLLAAVKAVYHAGKTRNVYGFLEEGDSKGINFYIILVFMFIIALIVCFLNVPLKEILNTKNFMFELVILIVIVAFLCIFKFLSLKREIIKFKDKIKFLSETEEEKLKEEIITLKNYDGSKLTKSLLIRFTIFACGAIKYNDIKKVTVEFVHARHSKGWYSIKIYDENYKLFGSVRIIYNNDAKKDLNGFLADLKKKCSNVSVNFSRNFFWPEYK